MTKKMQFPVRTSKIEEIKHSAFNTSDGKTMYKIEVSVENGDNFAVFKTNNELLSSLIKNDIIEYQLNKDEGKTKVKLIKKCETKPLTRYFSKINITDIMFLDIETVRIVEDIKLPRDKELNEAWAYLQRKNPTDLNESFKESAPLYAEFAKIVCISIGMIKDNGEVVIQSYYGDDEKDLLESFSKVLLGMYKKYPNLKIAGQNIISFDIPFLIKRLFVHRIALPTFIDTLGLKPWDVEDRFVDLARLWKSTSFYNVSLISTTTALGIPSSKSTLNGSMVSDFYYKKKLKEIVKYCEQDVLATVNITEHLYNRDISKKFTSNTFKNEKKN